MGNVIPLKLQTVIKSHLLIINLLIYFKFGHFDILDMLFPFLALILISYSL